MLERTRGYKDGFRLAVLRFGLLIRNLLQLARQPRHPSAEAYLAITAALCKLRL
jgi:hypothetical protein